MSSVVSDVLSATRAFLLSVLPPNVQVVQGYDNLVPPPVESTYVVMLFLSRARLGFNRTTYSIREKETEQPTAVTVQLDVHGPDSEVIVQIVSTLFMDAHACEFFASYGKPISPLYCSDARFIPFSNSSQQIERRWTIDITIQADPAVRTGQETAGELTMILSGVKPVDICL